MAIQKPMEGVDLLTAFRRKRQVMEPRNVAIVRNGSPGSVERDAELQARSFPVGPAGAPPEYCPVRR